MSVSDKIFFGGFVLIALVAGLCIGYGVADSRGRAVARGLGDRLATLERDHQLAIDAATDYRGELGRVGELAGQLGDGLADAVARAAKAPGYRAGAQIYIDAIREAGRGLGIISQLGAV